MLFIAGKVVVAVGSVFGGQADALKFFSVRMRHAWITTARYPPPMKRWSESVFSATSESTGNVRHHRQRYHTVSKQLSQILQVPLVLVKHRYIPPEILTHCMWQDWSLREIAASSVGGFSRVTKEKAAFRSPINSSPSLLVHQYLPSHDVYSSIPRHEPANQAARAL